MSVKAKFYNTPFQDSKSCPTVMCVTYLCSMKKLTIFNNIIYIAVS